MTEPNVIYLVPGEQCVISALPCEVEPPLPPEHPWTDMRADMPENSNPDDPYFVRNGLTDWWHREPEQLDAITIHHTLSHNPVGIADYITRSVKSGGKGRPSTEYTFWITQAGEILYCADIARGCWHDHTGHQNTHVSVGLAGRWDYEAPPQVQMQATADLCLHLMELYPSIRHVKGHCDYFATACPGWNGGGWKAEFYALLNPHAVSFALSRAAVPDYAAILECE